MELMDKVAYIRGLAEGLKFDFESDTGKLIAQLIEALGQTASELNELTEAYQELNDYVEMIDSDLDELETEFDEKEDDFDNFGDFDDEEEDDDFDLDGELLLGDEEEEGEDESDCEMFLGCICPECKGIFCVDAIDPDEQQRHICPHCEKIVVGIPMDIKSVPVAEPADEQE